MIPLLPLLKMSKKNTEMEMNYNKQSFGLNLNETIAMSKYMWSLQIASSRSIPHVNSLTTIGYLQEVSFRLWMPSLFHIST